jgi:hypothetical protein
MPTGENAGGSGGECIQPTTRDPRLLSRALAESWDIPEDIHKGIVDRLGAVVLDPDSKLRAVLAASKTLAGLSRINLAGVDVAIRAELHERLAERIEALEQTFGNRQSAS